MSENREYISYPDEMGTIRIADEVLAVVASSAALEVEGVSALAANLSTDLAELIGRKVYSKGVRMTVVDGKVILDISILIKYGCTIPDVAKKVQEAVKTAVVNTSGMDVGQVNIHVAGVTFPKVPKAPKAPKAAKEKQQ